MSRIRENESITGTSHQSWERWPNTTPIFRTCSLRDFQGTRPSIRHSPLSGVKIPLMILMVLLLPAPLGPMYPTISPAPTENDTSRRASTSVYAREKQGFDRAFIPRRADGRGMFYRYGSVQSRTAHLPNKSAKGAHPALQRVCAGPYIPRAAQHERRARIACSDKGFML